MAETHVLRIPGNKVVLDKSHAFKLHILLVGKQFATANSQFILLICVSHLKLF